MTLINVNEIFEKKYTSPLKCYKKYQSFTFSLEEIFFGKSMGEIKLTLQTLRHKTIHFLILFLGLAKWKLK